MILCCETSKPNVEATWLKNGKPLSMKDKKKYKLTSEGAKHTLTIPKCDMEDTAEFTCSIKGEKSHSQVTVKGRTLLKINVVVLMYCWPCPISVCYLEYFHTKKILIFPTNVVFLKPNHSQWQLPVVELPVTFTKPLQDTTAPEESSVILECEVSKPDASVEWLKDGKAVKPDKKKGVSTKSDGRRHSLAISSATPNDSGKYSAKAGDEQSSCILTVEGLCFLSLDG